MCLDGTGLDPVWGWLTVVFNATAEPTVQTVPALAGVPLTLHPELVESADPVLRTATATTSADGAVLSVPARSVAVFVASLS